jgi:hypothetical protein
MIILCSASLGGTVVSTLNSSSFNAGVERVMIGASGNHQSEFAAVMRILSRGMLSTRKIDALSAPALGASNLIFRNVAQGGTGSSTYVSLAGGATSLVVPRSISWAPGAPAQLSVEIIFFSADGSTAPVTVGSTTGGLTAEADVWVGGGTGISSIQVDFGYEIAIPPDGHLYPIQGFVVRQLPSVAVVGTSEALITQANIQPGAIATLTATFNKIADGGVRGAAKTFSVTGHQHAASVDGGQPGSVALVCAGKGGITVG